MNNKHLCKLFRSLKLNIYPPDYNLFIKYFNLVSIICISIWNFPILWANVFKSVSFSSYFDLSYSLPSNIPSYTNSLTFQDLLFPKNYIMDIVPGKFDDNNPRFTSAMCFPKSIRSISFADNFSFISLFKTFYNNFVSIFFPVFFYTMDCSWQLILLSIVSTFSIKGFILFFSSETCPLFTFLSLSISSNFSLMGFMKLLTFSMCLAPLIWDYFNEEATSKILFTFFFQILQAVV